MLAADFCGSQPGSPRAAHLSSLLLLQPTPSHSLMEFVAVLIPTSTNLCMSFIFYSLSAGSFSVPKYLYGHLLPVLGSLSRGAVGWGRQPWAPPHPQDSRPSSWNSQAPWETGVAVTEEKEAQGGM